MCRRWQKGALSSFKTLYDRVTKGELGTKKAYSSIYYNYTVGSSLKYDPASKTPFGVSTISEYDLADKHIAGMIWLDQNHSGFLDVGDSSYAGVKLTVTNQDTGVTYDQSKADENRSVSAMDGTYSLAVPDNGSYVVSMTVPEDAALVVKNASAEGGSVFDQKTAKTGTLVMNEEVPDGVLGKQNGGLFTFGIAAQDFSYGIEEGGITPDSAIRLAAASATDAGGNPGTLTLDEEQLAVINQSILNKKLDQFPLTFAYQDEGSGKTVKKTIRVTLKDHGTGGSGTVPADSGEYYPSGDETTDTVTVLPGTGLSRSGYYLVGWSEDPDADCNDESKFIRAGSTFRTGDRTDDVTLYAVWKICDPVKSGSPAEKKLNVTNLKPETDEIFRFALRAVSTDVEGLTKETMPLPEDGENRPIEGITITGAGTADFGDITFVVPGVYRYEVTETDEGADGYTYDSTVCTITYTVTQPDAATTALQCVRTIAGADGKTEETAAFTNIYTCEPTADNPSVEKKLEITDLNPEHDATFTFLLTPESTTAAGLTRETMPLPDGAENGVREATVTGTGTADFGSIPFTRTGIYVYTVTEKNSGDAGYVYNDRVYTLTYEVIRTGTRLVCTRTIADSSTQAEAEGCIFTNTYTCRETVDDLPLEKKISITDSEPEDTDFTFVLAPVNTTAEGIRTEDMPMPLDPDGKTVSEAVITGAGTAEFGTITFRHTGSYVYRLSERNDQAPGFTYDSTVYTVTYEVRQDGKNLVSVRTIRNQKREEAEKGLFVNSYDIASATDDPPVEKQVTVTDRQPATGEKFDFVLTPATCSVAEMTTADMPMPDGSTDQKKTVSVVGAGSAEFGRLAFRRAGTYVYTISEVGGIAEGYTYDTAVYTMTYEVSREGDRLVSRRTITGADGNAADRPVFTNVYTRHASDHGGSSGGGGVTPKHAVPTETPVIVETTKAEPATEEQAPEIGVLPKTGDELPFILLLCLLLCSGTGLLFLAAGKRRAGRKWK